MHRVILIVLAFGLVLSAASGRAQTLAGAIDFHAHADPDGIPRKIDVVRKEVPGIEVFGGISLDLTVGGVNPAAVEWMTKVRGGYGKVVWLPTFDSESQVRLTKEQRPFAPVTRDGEILPDVLQVIALAARHDVVLETGHSAPQESLQIIAEAKRQGVKHVLVTHAMTNPGGPMTLDEMREAARRGIVRAVERSRATTESPAHRWPVGHDQGLMAQGISAADIDLMSRKNPARLLGLEH